MPDKNEKQPSVYTPNNEPYLGRASVFAFDQTISFSLWVNESIATFTRSHKGQLSSLQSAASQIIPQGINLALSIRELVRQGYLFVALVLMRPLIERAAMISYICEHPDAITLWHNGWRFQKRPSLSTMLQAMARHVDVETTKTICEHYNHIVHGDPVGAEWNTVDLRDGGKGYSVGKVIDNPDLCDELCIQGTCYLTVLAGKMIACFPEVSTPARSD